MDIGVFVPLGNGNASPEILRAMGREVEDRGFESIWVPEHVVLFDEYRSSYPYSPDGTFPGGADSGMLEPLGALSFLAAVTDLDSLSGGRVDFGVGVGWLREEFEVVAMPFERRGRRTDEHLAVMKTLWCDEVSEYHGELYDLDPCRMYPKPVQDPHPPIHVGGESDAALRRVARVGQGWFSMNRLPADLPEPLGRLDALLDEHGRRRGRGKDEVLLSVCPYFNRTTPEMVEQYVEAGVDRLIVVCLAFDVDTLRNQLDDLVADVLEPSRV